MTGPEHYRAAEALLAMKHGSAYTVAEANAHATLALAAALALQVTAPRAPHTGSREHQPCPAKATAILGFPEPTLIPCGLADRHVGPHRYAIEWIEPTDATSDGAGETRAGR